jgi:hypothetical protein
MARRDFARSRQDENMRVEQQRVAAAGPVAISANLDMPA